MTAEADIAAIDNGGANTAAEVRTALTSVLDRAGISVVKTSDESVTSSTTLQDDDELLFAVGANEEWVVEFFLRCDGATGGDFKATVSAPSGSTGWAGVVGPGTTATTFENATANNQLQNIGAAPPVGMLGTGNSVLVLVSAYIAVGGTSGNVVLQWAQQASSGTATRVLIGSHLTAHKVG